MKTRSMIAAVAALVAAGCFWALPLQAQSSGDNSAPAPNFLGFVTHGDIGASYRFADVSGSQQQYNDLLDLRKGLGLSDFDVYGKNTAGSNPWADSFSLSASGIGNNPFPTAQLTAHKTGVYDLRVDFRQSTYLWGQNDTRVINGEAGVTPNHSWATTRRYGTVDLAFHLTRGLRLRVSYEQNDRSGWEQTTRSLDFYGSPSFWGGFARANPYLVTAPLNDTDQRFGAGIDYSSANWTFHYMTGLERLNENVNGVNLASPELSINTSDPTTAAEPLSSLNWVENTHRSSPFQDISYRGQLTPSLEWDGAYVMYRFQGPATLNMLMNGVARKNTGGTADAPYSVSLSSNSYVSEPEQVVRQGMSWNLNHWASFVADYRYERVTSTAAAEEQSTYNGTPYSNPVDNQWILGISQVDAGLLLSPFPTLQIHPGVTLMKEDVEFLSEGVTDPLRTHRIKTAWPQLGVSYRPWSRLSLSGDVQSITRGTSYTALTPHTDVTSHWKLRYSILDNLLLSESFNTANSTFIDVDYHSRARANGTALTYEFSSRFSMFAAANYSVANMHGDVNFIRGTAPLQQMVVDRIIERVWQAGFHTEPLPRLTISFSGNYVRMTGFGELTGEAPGYGPLRYPYATGNIAYAVPGVGQFFIDLQRAYYLEDLYAGNNFGANLLTIGWKRSF